MFNEKNLTKLIIFLPIFFILITIFSGVYITLSLLNSHFDRDIKIFEQSELKLQRQYIKSQIDSIYDYIEYKKKESTTRLEKRLKDRVYTGYELATKIYEQNKNKLKDEELQKLILETLRKVRYGVDGYYFIAHIKSDTEIITKMLPATPNAENVNAFNLKDEDNNYYVQKFAKVVTQNKDNEGYVNYKWYKLSKKVQFEKISFVKLFEPYNWFIGYGEYYDDFNETIKKEAIKRIDQYRYETNGYIWTMDSEHILIQHPFVKSLLGKDNRGLKDKKGKLFVKELVSTALNNKNGGYVNYYWNKPGEIEPTKKIAYVKYIPQWDWVISTGVYLDDIKVSVDILTKEKEKEVSEITSNSLLLSVVILFIVSFVSYLISKRVSLIFLNYKNKIDKHQEELEQINDSLAEKVDEKTKELTKLNEELEEKIERRVKEINEKDRTLAQQSKMAALGEMIGNIAHQWRQPLSAISTAASGVKLKKEMGMLTDEELIEFSDGIVKNSKYLSQVIEDFKNYIRGEKERVKFDVNDAISNALSIFDSSIHNHKLTIVEDLSENIFIYNYKNEFVQAFVNILNNAKDALKQTQKNEEDRIIIISSKIVDEKVVLSVVDSAKGIDENVLGKIFEPYFTTKDKEQGTGLGLYMTYQIIVDSMKGKIEASNTSFEYNEKEYKGAEFTLTFELSS